MSKLEERIWMVILGACAGFALTIAFLEPNTYFASEVECVKVTKRPCEITTETIYSLKEVKK